MAALAYKQTEDLIFFVLNHALGSQMRVDLHDQLKQLKSNEG